MKGMIYLTSGARLLAEVNGGDAAEWLDLLNQAVGARELAVPRGGGEASMLPGGVSYIPRGSEMRAPVAGFIRWCEQRGYSLETKAKAGDPPPILPVLQQQIAAIEAAARSMGYADPLNIPQGGKAKIRAECGKLTDAQFKRAWQAGVTEGKLRMAGHDVYARRIA